MINVLVFPCGSEIGLEVFYSLNNQKNINLYGASSVDDHGKFVYNNYISNVPFINEKNFVDHIKKLRKQYNIDYIYPCLDSAINVLKSNEDKIGCTVLSSPEHTVSICFEKLKTYKFFKNKINTPEVYFDLTQLEYPVFSKPNIGARSINAYKINCPEDLNYYKNKYPNNIILEYLPGEEFTVDCFTDKKRNLLYVQPRKRSRVNNGISVGTKFFDDKKIFDIAKVINDSLIFNGSWFFQLKIDKNNNYSLLEIAPRIAGSSMINRLIGVNFPYLNILNEIGEVSILKNSFNLQTSRSLNTLVKLDIEYKNIYVDFDDTLIINNKVNTTLMSFIYKCLNNNKNVILITKHEHDIFDSLKKYKINKEIFYNIIQIKKNEPKSKYIKSNNSIYIDDSFSERKEVFLKCKIPVFSIDVLDQL